MSGGLIPSGAKDGTDHRTDGKRKGRQRRDGRRDGQRTDRGRMTTTERTNGQGTDDDDGTRRAHPNYTTFTKYIKYELWKLYT